MNFLTVSNSSLRPASKPSESWTKKRSLFLNVISLSISWLPRYWIGESAPGTAVLQGYDALQIHLGHQPSKISSKLPSVSCYTF
jgi:hypothetical protein